MAFRERQERLARLVQAKFLRRYEYPSLWETREAHDELAAMWGRDALAEDAAEGVDAQRDDPWPDSPCVDPPDDPDREKPRASVEEYVALIGDAVALNLDSLARARVEKQQRQYRTDAEIVQAYATSITGGDTGRGADDDECEACQAPTPHIATVL